MGNTFYRLEQFKEQDCPLIKDRSCYEHICSFLRAIERWAPKVVNDLKQLIPVYTAAATFYIDTRPLYSSEWIFVKASDDENLTQLLPLKKGLIAWARKFHLVDDELMETLYIEIALWTLDVFFHNPDPNDFTLLNGIGLSNELEQPRKYYPPFVFAPMSPIQGLDRDKEDFNLTDFELLFVEDNLKTLLLKKGFTPQEPMDFWKNVGLSWDPESVPWKEFEGKIIRAVKTYLKFYKRRTEEIIKNNGFLEGVSKREERHFEWLVRYQIIGEESMADIAERAHAGDDTVRKAIHVTADHVLLPLRSPNPGGRRKK
jgi:hypothetical protein